MEVVQLYGSVSGLLRLVIHVLMTPVGRGGSSPPACWQCKPFFFHLEEHIDWKNSWIAEHIIKRNVENYWFLFIYAHSFPFPFIPACFIPTN